MSALRSAVQWRKVRRTCPLIGESVINLCALLTRELVTPGLTKPLFLSLARRSNSQLNQDRLMRLCLTWLFHLSWISLFYFRTTGPWDLSLSSFVYLLFFFLNTCILMASPIFYFKTLWTVGNFLTLSQHQCWLTVRGQKGLIHWLIDLMIWQWNRTHSLTDFPWMRLSESISGQIGIGPVCVIFCLILCFI